MDPNDSQDIFEDEVNFLYNINSFCRICLKQNDNSKLTNIFEGLEPLSLLIVLCANVEALSDDGLPNSICQTCLTKLSLAWEFKLLCEQSDVRLRQFFSSSSILQLIDNMSTSDIDIDKISCDFSDFRNNPLVNDVLLNGNPLKKKVDELLPSPLKATVKEPKIVKLLNLEYYQCEICEKIFQKKDYLVQHHRTHTGEKPYCCHICEKCFSASGHLAVHLRIHTGEKRHACTLCPLKFSTRYDLLKHEMVHRGERPHVCHLCQKKFGSSSNLYAHLKHHTGDKHFSCEVCSKLFFTKQELKQHNLIHTGVKAHVCQTCKKSFSQVAHLRRHALIHTRPPAEQKANHTKDTNKPK